LGWGFSLGLVGCDEQPAITAVASRIISSFFIATFPSSTRLASWNLEVHSDWASF
jgi:hypothetical protein